MSAPSTAPSATGPLAVAALVAATSAPGALGAAGPGDGAARYVDLYGLADPAATPEVARAERMFERLERVAGGAPGDARLLVVDSDDKPWAVALADDSVVLSRGALDVVYRDDDLERGDAELAFVLGHELAHLGTRDLWHQQVRASLAGGATAAADAALARLEDSLAKASLDLAAWRERELRADELGFTFAALGGYAVERLLGPGGTDFLSIWVEQTRAGGGATHHGARERTAFLRARLERAAEDVRTFEAGVRLAHFGRHADALALFEDFAQDYPSPEVLSNVGYARLQLAREAMPARLAYRFWLPTLLETEPGLRVPTRGLDDALPEAARRLLETAAASFEAALERDGLDLVASMNLVAARWYLNQPFHARAAVEDALRHRPGNVQLRALRALVLLDQDPEIDMGPRVIDLLEGLAAGGDAPINVLFNLARVLDERRRAGRAARLWARLLERRDELPEVYALIVCERAGGAGPCPDRTARRRLPGSVAALFPVVPGTSVERLLERSVRLVHRMEPRRAAGVDATLYELDVGSVLAIGDTVELAVARPGPDWTPARLAETLGEPLVIAPTDGGRLHTYGAGVSALVRDGAVAELWLGR